MEHKQFILVSFWYLRTSTSGERKKNVLMTFITHVSRKTEWKMCKMYIVAVWYTSATNQCKGVFLRFRICWNSNVVLISMFLHHQKKNTIFIGWVFKRSVSEKVVPIRDLRKQPPPDPGIEHHWRSAGCLGQCGKGHFQVMQHNSAKFAELRNQVVLLCCIKAKNKAICAEGNIVIETWDLWATMWFCVKRLEQRAGTRIKADDGRCRHISPSREWVDSIPKSFLGFIKHLDLYSFTLSVKCILTVDVFRFYCV